MATDGHTQRAVNDATSQLDRQLSGVAPELGAVDSRSFAQLLSFAADYGELLHFYDLEDRVDGDWRLFFSADSTQVSAGIVSVDLDALERRFVEAYARASTPGSVSERVEALTELVELALGLALRFDGWQLGAAESEHAELLGAQLRRLVDVELGPRVRELYGVVQAAGDAGLSWPELGFERLSPRWRLSQASAGEPTPARRNWSERIDQALAVVQATFDALVEALALLQGDAADELERDLVGGRRRPQLALWISFVDLFRRAQRAANSIADRYVDFYYRDVLRMSEAAAQPDSAYLVLALAESEEPEQTWIDAGTEFTAETEDGASLIYAAVEGLAVSSAALADVRTLRVTRTCLGGADPSTGACEPALFVPKVVSESIVDLEALAEPPSDAGTSRGFSTFGRALGPGEDAQQDGVELTTLASLGLLIASDELALAGGTRRVTLSVGFGEFAAVLRSRIDAIRTTPVGEEDPIFATMLAAGFALRVSTADGWVAVSRYQVPTASLEAATFTLQFDLPPSFPALAPMSDEVETPPGAPEARTPCLVLDLRQEPIVDSAVWPRFEPTYLLSLLAGMPIVSLELGVEVWDMTPTVIANSDGEIDPSNPFSVFGASPVVGSYLRLECAELFAKQISTLDLTINWYDLPSGPEGFYGYYSGYTLCPCLPGQTVCFDNCSFKVDLALGEAGLWSLDPSSACDKQLFRGKLPTQDECGDADPDPRGPLCGRSVFALGVASNTSELDYYVPADNYLDVRLVSPSYAFGDSLYAENVLAAVVQYLPDCIECTSKCEARYVALRDAAEIAARCLLEPSTAACSCFATVKALLEQGLAGCVASGCDNCGSCDYFNVALTAVQNCIDGGCSGTACDELPTLLASLYQQALTECIGACSSPPKQLDYPNAPYQPQATAVTLHYASGGPLVGELQHLLPFAGRQTLAPPGSDLAPPLLPEFAFAGAQYLGFSALQARSALTLLFRMTATPGPESRPAVRWSSLGEGADRRPSWNPLEPSADGTAGLGNTGILALRSVGASLVEGLGFADGLHWLRATVEAEPERFPNTVAIDPHALVVRDQGRADDPRDRYHRLPAHSITASVEELGPVASIDQPLPTFGGHPADDRGAFWLRAGERLRHKSRAIQAWDYERLVLERHPWVWKVRVLQAHDLGRSRRPGAVLVLVIPKLEEAVGDDPRTPRASPEQLLAVRETLTRRASVFAQIEVVNANYRDLTVTTSLAFVAGDNPVTLRERLDAELVAFLSPGFFDLQREALGGAYVEDDEIEAFVQSRPYVRYVESLTTTRASAGFDATLDWCFLTSAPSHTIVEVDGPRCQEDAWSNR